MLKNRIVYVKIESTDILILVFGAEMIILQVGVIGYESEKDSIDS